MAKGNKNGAQKSAAEAAAAQAAPMEASVPATVEDPKVLTPNQASSLSPDAKVKYIDLLQRRYIDDKEKKAAYPTAFINGIDMIIDCEVIDIAVGQIAAGKDVFSFIVANNESNYAALAAMAATRGVQLKSFKSLPTPTKEQLAQAGLSGVDAMHLIAVDVKPEDVSQEAKNQKKAENAIAKKIPLDPTKIENEEQLREQLTRCLVSDEHPILRMMKVINFYNAYLLINAKKAENSEEEIKKVKDMSRIDQLREITEIIGPCTFAMSGLAHFLNTATNQTGSPISAFCAYKRAIATIGEKAAADDQFIADIVKILIIWSCTSKISELNGLIAACDENLKKLSKDKKANAAQIKTEQTFKSNHESEIVGFQGIIDCVNNPSFDIVTNLVENYNGDAKAIKTKIAHRIVSNIIDTFYPDTKPADYEKDSLLGVSQYHAGTILNMFCNPLERNITYVDASLPELVKKSKEPSKTEEPATEEAPKN